MKFACRDIRYITDPLRRHEKAFLKSFLSGVYAGVIMCFNLGKTGQDTLAFDMFSLRCLRVRS